MNPLKRVELNFVHYWYEKRQPSQLNSQFIETQFSPQLAHGADPYMKNQEGQTALELATAEDVKCLLQDAMVASQQNLPTTSASAMASCPSPTTETVTLPTGASMTLSVPVPQVKEKLQNTSKTN